MRKSDSFTEGFVMTSENRRAFLSSEERRDAFLQLADRVAACRRCPSMDGRRRVLSAANGPLDALVLFVAEAPGRLGADRTGIPLSHDRSGKNFERLLECAGLNRDDIFITNAVLCNPRDTRNRNRPPSPVELRNCTSYLRQQLALVSARIVVTLGVMALRALDDVESHGLSLRAHVGQPVAWFGRVLVPLYHPSDQAMLHRPLAVQEQDYRALGKLVRSLSPCTT